MQKSNGTLLIGCFKMNKQPCSVCKTTDWKSLLSKPVKCGGDIRNGTFRSGFVIHLCGICEIKLFIGE